MTEFAPDVRYAYLMLGLDAGASLDRITVAFTHAMSYRYRTQDRINTVRNLMEFFAGRAMLGEIHDSFTVIQKNYRDKARELHPDLNRDDPYAEEKLKEINVAYGIVDAVNREAKNYFEQPDDVRQAAEDAARLAYARESGAQERRNPEQEPPPGTRQKRAYEKPEGSAARAGVKYMAASVPRSIRSARLNHIPPSYIIGSWHVQDKRGAYHAFDVIMMPEREFARARIYLSVPTMTDPALQRGGFSPTYIVKDVREIAVPVGTLDPQHYARDYFLKEFGIEGRDG